MTTINLKDHYPWYTEDTFKEVPDEIAAFLDEDRRLQINYAQYIRDNKAFYSLDAGDGIEAGALNLPEQPDEALERMELERLLRLQPPRASAKRLSERVSIGPLSGSKKFSENFSKTPLLLPDFS